MPPCGLLCLNKPTDMSSRAAVNVVQRLARPTRVGHAGTLDPLADGVLVVGVGSATRLLEYVQQTPKHYVGTFLLGRHSPTEDIEGEVTELPDAAIPTREQIAAAAERFIGRIAQRPPAFSALKVGGRRAYQLARQGKSPQLAPRPVEIFRIEVPSYRYPKLVLNIECGSGTYIRSLGRDLAESLGTAAVMSALTRTAIGPFRLEDAIAPGELRGDNWLGLLRPPLEAVAHLACITLSPEEVIRIRNGQSIAMESPTAVSDQEGQPFAAVDAMNRLVAILVGDGVGRMRPFKGMAP
jgi:tRNA pseudouridine55 synthase